MTERGPSVAWLPRDDEPVTGQRIVAEARGWLGVRFRHRGRGRDGVDCVGLALCVARALGLAPADHRDYPRRPDPEALHLMLAEQLIAIDPARVRPGDLLRLAVRGRATHLAIVTELAGRPGLLHAHAPSRRVIEHRWNGRWPGPAVDAWRLPGLGEAG